MIASLYRFIESALELDPSLTLEDKETILACCRSPEKFREKAWEPSERLLTQAKTCEILSISRSSIWRLCKKAQLHPVFFFDSPRFRMTEILALMAEKEGHREGTDAFTTLYKGKKGT